MLTLSLFNEISGKFKFLNLIFFQKFFFVLLSKNSFYSLSILSLCLTFISRFYFSFTLFLTLIFNYVSLDLGMVLSMLLWGLALIPQLNSYSLVLFDLLLQENSIIHHNYYIAYQLGHTNRRLMNGDTCISEGRTPCLPLHCSQVNLTNSHKVALLAEGKQPEAPSVQHWPVSLCFGLYYFFLICIRSIWGLLFFLFKCFIRNAITH